MKKFFAFLVFALVYLTCFAAHAQTITLLPESCPNRSCSDVPNDAGTAISLGASTYNANMFVMVDGKLYTGNRTSLVVTDASAGGVCTAADGSTITVATTWSHYTRVINSGRTHYSITFWTLTGGQITGVAP